MFVESVGGLLNSEAQTLDTEINDLAVLDPELAGRAEKLRCTASASAMKAMSSGGDTEMKMGLPANVFSWQFHPKKQTDCCQRRGGQVSLQCPSSQI